MPSRPPDFDGGLGVERPRELGDVRKFSHEAMNTVFEVFAVHHDEHYVAHASQAVFALVDRLENELSRFRANSDITRVNHLKAGESTRVGQAAFECLLIAQHLYDLSDGAFDISIGTGLRSLELDHDQSAVRASADGVRVDLGGIGKGYAVDLMAEVLEEWGLTRAFVHGGFSSVIALDPPEGRDGWALTLSDPAEPARVLVRLSICQTAMAASGIRKTDHIRDPRSGEPVRGRLGTWVALPRPQAPPEAGEGPRLAPAAVADALTTAFMLLSVERIEALVAGSPGLRAWVLPEGEREVRHFGASAP